MTAQKLLNDLFNSALVMGLGTGFAVAQILAPIRRATP
jgi:hypothetical protein